MEEEGATCRICYCGNEDEPLCSPCKCSGTVKYLHQSCWDQYAEHKAKDSWNGKCESCTHTFKTRIVDLPVRNVTWPVFLQAVGMYLLFGLHFILLIGCYLLSAAVGNNLKTTMSTFSQGIFICYTIPVTCGLLIWRYCSFLTVTSRYLPKPSLFPIPGNVRSPRKLKNITLRGFLNTDGRFLGLYALLTLGGTIVLKLLDVFVHAVTPPPEKLIVSTTEAPTLFSGSWNVDISEYTPLICAIIFVLLGAFLSAIRHETPEQGWSFTIFSVRSTIIGRIVNALITNYCSGYYVACYASFPAYDQLVWDLVFGMYLEVALVLPVVQAYARLYRLDTALFFKPVLFAEKTKSVLRCALGLLFSLLWVFVAIFGPLFIISRFLPYSNLNLGKLFLPVLKEDNATSIGQWEWRLIDGIDYNATEVSFSDIGFANTGYFLKMYFLIHYVFYVAPICSWFSRLTTLFFGNISARTLRAKITTVTLQTICMAPIITVSLSAFLWLLMLLGRVLLSFTPLPFYFDIYRGDVLVELAVGFIVFRIPFVTLKQFSDTVGKFLLSFLVFFTYAALEGDITISPLLPDTLFILNWVYLSFRAAAPVESRNGLHNYLLFPALWIFLLPAYIIKWSYGFEHIFEAYDSFAFGMTVAAVVLITALFLIGRLLYLLSYHLKYEHGDISVVLVDYVPGEEREGNVLQKVKIKYEKVLAQYGPFNIYLWLMYYRNPVPVAADDVEANDVEDVEANDAP